MTGRRWMRVFVLIGAAVASGCLLASAGAHTNALANVGWGGFGNTPDENRHSPLTQIDTSNVGQLGRAFTVDFHAIDSTRAPRRAVVSGRVERDAVLDHERRQRLGARRDHGQGQVALDARRRRRLPQLRHRRQPRRRALRRPRLRAHARHDDRPARSRHRPAAAARRDRAGRPRRLVGLRLLGDERADLRRPPSDRRRRRLRVRRPRLRDGLPHLQPRAGLAEPVLDDPAGRHRVAASRHARRRRRRLDADHGRHLDEHAVLRHRLGHAALLPVASGPARIRAPTRSSP